MSADESTATFAKRVQDLPAELFSQIQSYVFDSPRCERQSTDSKRSRETEFVTKIWEFPSTLQVSRHSRNLIAKQYFTNRKFVFTSRRLCYKFIFALGQHLEFKPAFKTVMFDDSPKTNYRLPQHLDEYLQHYVEGPMHYGLWTWVECSSEGILDEDLEWWTYQEGVRVEEIFVPYSLEVLLGEDAIDALPRRQRI